MKIHDYELIEGAGRRYGQMRPAQTNRKHKPTQAEEEFWAENIVAEHTYLKKKVEIYEKALEEIDQDYGDDTVLARWALSEGAEL